MPEKLPPIYFYIPQTQWPKIDIFESPEEYWQWQNSLRYGQGRYNWTLQTYLHLKSHGFPCQLLGTMPDEGIVLSHRDFLPDHLKPTPKLLIVCLQADKIHHPYAQFHVIQNTQDVLSRYSANLWPTHYMPHWPQSGLLPRSADRGDKFENVAYFGQVGNLTPELQTETWQQQVKALGLNWHIIPFELWHDYRDVDVVIAVRSFDGNKHNCKPASKMYNAWHAGVPIILNPESAYEYERKSDLDYIEVTSVDEIITALKRLRSDKKLLQSMIENGRIRAQETTIPQLTRLWQDFLTEIATPAYYRWRQAADWQIKLFLQRRYLSWKFENLKKKLGKVISQPS